MDALEKIILDPHYHDLLAIIKGFRNGIVYGAKIRFPHALVMTFLFRGGSLQDKIKVILRATRQHARGLAFFVTTYKTIMLILYKLAGNKEHSINSFIAGCIGGYFVFGENNNINFQIVLYVFSRVMVGLGKMMVKHNNVEAPPKSFSIFAALVWGAVMWQFRHEREVLQPSLQASMQYLYNDSNRWDSVRNWIWHNK
ncbi:uncharacterized protein VTP21DRAFT_2046 [Calcarisporiella thermophila]|uniref:uncharacterized protein n=1 Tax=Calcarisporiella thermophila TaxID=911321 RepID=UPI0037448B33